MEKYPALVGIVKNESQWELIKNKKWYHMPVLVNSVPENPELMKCIAFYFPTTFGREKELQGKIIYYADVLNVETKKRIELFPNEPGNKRANEDYFQFYLGEIKKLPGIITSRRERTDIIHIPTNTEKLFSAEEINDLWWDESPLENIMHSEFKKRKMQAERQWHARVHGQNYFLDFALSPDDKKIDVECDGSQHFASQEAIDADKERDKLLEIAGWKILRFTWDQIHQNLEECFADIESEIKDKFIKNN